ncbi:MAG: M48 family metalloprotease, partial [Halioglobus sp.]|nr:M48 family metalloprotease [Halioglobus sp.]
MTRAYRFSLLLAVSCLLVACAYNPATGGASVVMSSTSGEAATGEKMYKDIVDKGGVYDDPELQAYVDKIGRRLLAHSNMAERDFTFTVVDSPDINAFATPGGYVYI